MNETIANFINNYSSIKTDSLLVLAVSGGVDSMVMAHLFHQLGYNIIICHVNHGLRGEDSQADEVFVKSFADERNLAFYSSNISTELAEFPSGNMHQLARDLRYAFFEKIRLSEKADFILTAHHADDTTETILFNFFRGTGIEGLKGIPISNGHIFRPFAQTSKQSIATYAQENELEYREDASNLLPKYSRNRIRLELIPLLEELFPNLDQRISSTKTNLSSDFQLLEYLIARQTEAFVKLKNEHLHISKEVFQNKAVDASLLFRIIKPYGFNLDTCENILHHENENGQTYHSQFYSLYNERNQLIIKKKDHAQVFQTIEIKANDDRVQIDSKTILNIEYKSIEELDFEKHDACFDVRKLSFPLKIRAWDSGDKYKPLGLSGQYQKIAKALQNYKVDTHLKSSSKVLVSGSEIAWLIPHRISETFKVDDRTLETMCLNWVEK